MSILKIAIGAAVCLLIILNAYFIVEIKTELGIENNFEKKIHQLISEMGAGNRSTINIELTGNLEKDAMIIIENKGEPEIYGKELKVSYEKIQGSIDIMKNYDPSLNALSNEQLERYKDVTGKISCEFCCTVKALTNADGTPTCSCEHAKAMRGLAIYLIKNYSGEYSDRDVLRELAKWKGSFFPKQMAEKVAIEIQKGVYSPDVDVLLDGLKLPSYEWTDLKDYDEIEKMPDMVGGC